MLLYRLRLVAAACLVAVASACSSTSPAPDPSTTTSSPSVPGATPSAVSPSPTGEPTSEPTPEPIPARTPRGIAAITESGDVVLVDLDGLTRRTIASYPPVEAGDDDAPVSSFLTDVAVFPDGRILLSTCCEPAAGYIRVLNERGKELPKTGLGGDDPEVDPSGRRLAMAFLQSLGIWPASLHRDGFDDIVGRGLFSPSDPGWSPDGTEVIFSFGRRLGLVEVTAKSLGDARYLSASDGMYWASTAYLRSGPLAVEIEGNQRQQVQGASRIVRVDVGTGQRRVVMSSAEAITDLATDRAGTALLWVEGGTLHWRVTGTEGSLPGEFLKAAFFPG